MKKAVSALLVVGAVVLGGSWAVGALKHWNDPQHCWGWTPGKLLDGGGKAQPMSRQPESFRAAVEHCIEQRRTHRSGVFGLVTDRVALPCERRWNSYEDFLRQGQPVAAHSVAESSGISDRLDPSSPADRKRFIDACLPIRSRQLRSGD